jgi:hypothetical protein
MIASQRHSPQRYTAGVAEYAERTLTALSTKDTKERKGKALTTGGTEEHGGKRSTAEVAEGAERTLTA